MLQSFDGQLDRFLQMHAKPYLVRLGSSSLASLCGSHAWDVMEINIGGGGGGLTLAGKKKSLFGEGTNFLFFLVQKGKKN